MAHKQNLLCICLDLRRIEVQRREWVAAADYAEGVAGDVPDRPLSQVVIYLSELALLSFEDVAAVNGPRNLEMSRSKRHGNEGARSAPCSAK